jgi:hypothetical protein
MLTRFAIILWILPLPLAAQDILEPEEFETYAEGYTLYFSQQGTPYGVEQYLPNRESIWQFADGICKRGIWYTRKEQICFLYEGDSEAQCWHFLKKGETYAARAEGREPEADLDVIWKDDRPIECLGPDVGT